MSIKNINRWIVITTSILFIGILLVYTIAIVPLRKDLTLLHEYEMNLTELGHDLSLPLRVVRNILSQEDYFENENLLEAYSTNIYKALEITEMIDLNIFNIESIIEENFFIRNNLRKLDNDINEDLSNGKNLNNRIENFLNSSEEIQRETTFDYVAVAERELEVELSSIEDSILVATENTYTELIWLFNIILITFVLHISSLLFIQLRNAYFKKHFTDLSYKKFEMHNYEADDLERFKAIFKEEKDTKNQVLDIFYEQSISSDAKNIMNDSYDMDKVLEKLFLLSKRVLDITRIGIAFVDYDNQVIFTEGAESDYKDVLLDIGYQVSFTETSLSKILMDRKSVIENDLIKRYQTFNESETLKLITDEGIKSNMTVPLISGERVYGFIFFSSPEKNHFTAYHQRIAEKIVFEVTEILKRSYLVKVVFKGFTNSMSHLVDNRDSETGDHLNRMTEYAVVIAEALQKKNLQGYSVSRGYIKEIAQYASAHDIGKVAIPDSILKKPGKLSEKEYSIMKTHTTIGADIFNKLRNTLKVFDKTYFKVAEEIVGGHHEKWDGSGYPNGLKGNEIPLAARIVALADVFDALTSHRIYKPAFPFDQSIKIIQEESGKHFDPIIVEAFLGEIFKVKRIHDLSKISNSENLLKAKA